MPRPGPKRTLLRSSARILDKLVRLAKPAPSTFASVDEAIADTPSADVPALLAGISLEDWGELLLDVPAAYPNLRDRFPSMPSDEVQDSWTGRHGTQLLAQSVWFTRWLVSEYEDATGMRIGEARVLDFGCGWGRLMRLLFKYVDVERIYGVDPWDESIRLCREHGVPGNLAISEYVPNELPFDGPFDLIYAYSVFTHLSEWTTQVALETLRRYIAPGGALAITIRPPDYWQYSGQPTMVEEHQRRGFAFVPHKRAPIEGDITYGDTSMSTGYIQRHFPFWRIIRQQQTGSADPYQAYLLLVPV
jgi:hypothetical protein